MEKHWVLNSWIAEAKPFGYGFQIWVSKQFLETAARVPFKKQAVWEAARDLFRSPGYTVDDSYDQILFGKWGWKQINHPKGDGCWVQLTALDTSDIERGLYFDTHNVNTASELCSLLAVLLSWINYVEICMGDTEDD